MIPFCAYHVLNTLGRLDRGSNRLRIAVLWLIFDHLSLKIGNLCANHNSVTRYITTFYPKKTVDTIVYINKMLLAIVPEFNRLN